MEHGHPRRSAAKTRILIVTDDEHLRSQSEGLLRAEGFSVNHATCGAEAVQLSSDPSTDLVLVDCTTVAFDGVQVCEALHKLSERNPAPVILLTAPDDAETGHRGRQAGAKGTIARSLIGPAMVQRIRFELGPKLDDTNTCESRELLQAALREARLGYWRWNQSSGWFELSDSLCEICAIARDDAPTTLDGFLDLVAEEDRKQVHDRVLAAADREASSTFDYRLNDGNNEFRLVEQSLSHLTGRETELLGTVQDVTSRRESEDRMRRLAYFDPLTGLASRSHLMQQLEDTINAAYRRKESFTVLFLDLDGFKDVNDSLGHDIGDVVLIEVARRLQGVLRNIDFVSRFGGDEFCVLLNDQRDDLDAAEVAARCLEVINEKIRLGSQQWRPRVSIGLARFPGDGDTARQLLKAADSAMYAAKQAGKHRYAFYRPEMTEEAERRLAEEHSLRTAIEEEQFELYYQPQISLRDGCIVAIEALLRWQRPGRGLVLPRTFMPTLDRMGLTTTLGSWVLQKACMQAAEWQDVGMAGVRVAVNLSPSQFLDHSTPAHVANALEQSGLAPELLELELIENCIQSDDEASASLHKLRSLGVRISIDDFGTGHAPLCSLKKLPIDTLKIDHTLINNMLNTNGNAVMLGTVIGLAHALGCTVVAEDVEDLDQARVLAGLRCDIAQGFLFSKPVPATQIADLRAKGAFLDVAKGTHLSTRLLTEPDCGG